MRPDEELQLGPNHFGIEYKLPKDISERNDSAPQSLAPFQLEGDEQ